jgi:hypothetical protein
VDDKEQVIVAADVSQNATDHAEFKPMVNQMVQQLERNLGNLPKEGSAGAGYSFYDTGLSKRSGGENISSFHSQQ